MFLLLWSRSFARRSGIEIVDDPLLLGETVLLVCKPGVSSQPLCMMRAIVDDVYPRGALGLQEAQRGYTWGLSSLADMKEKSFGLLNVVPSGSVSVTVSVPVVELLRLSRPGRACNTRDRDFMNSKPGRLVESLIRLRSQLVNGMSLGAGNHHRSFRFLLPRRAISAL